MWISTKISNSTVIGRFTQAWIERLQKGILKEFDAAHEQLQGNKELHDMPMQLKNKIDKISIMLIFKDEFLKFLDAYRFPPITLHRYDGWVHFLHLYVKVIEDIPLVVAGSSTSIHGSTKYISHVTVNFEAARETVVYEGFEELIFKVTWKIYDKNGQSGEIFIINSFSV